MSYFAIFDLLYFTSSVATCLRCCGKYNKGPAANLLLCPIVKEFWQEAQLSQRDRATLRGIFC